MVDAAIGSGHAASGVDTGGMDRGCSALCGGGASPGDSTVDGLSGVEILESSPPFGIEPALGDLAGEVGTAGSDSASKWIPATPQTVTGLRSRTGGVW